MNRLTTIILAAAVLALPAAAIAAKPATNPGKGHDKAAHTPKGKAYGKYCQGNSKKRVKGDGLKGSEFSRCVQAMAKAVDEGDSPRKACLGLSKKHVKGEKGTEFSRCKVDAAHAKKNAAADDEAEDPADDESGDDPADDDSTEDPADDDSTDDPADDDSTDDPADDDSAV